MRAKNKRPLGLLPHNYCEDDGQWLSGKLDIFKEKERAAVCAAYAKVFREEYEKEPQEIKKENAARRAANLRLIKYIAKL